MPATTGMNDRDQADTWIEGSFWRNVQPGETCYAVSNAVCVRHDVAPDAMILWLSIVLRAMRLQLLKVRGPVCGWGLAKQSHVSCLHLSKIKDWLCATPVACAQSRVSTGRSLSRW